MPRPRNPENRGLPTRWKHEHGTYFYQVPPGMESQWNGKKKFPLGKTLHEAYDEWARRLKDLNTGKTIADLLDRYAFQVVPTKAARTQSDNHDRIPRIRAVFGANTLAYIKPQHIYMYVDKAGNTEVSRKDMKLFSHVFTKAVEWGLIDRHPFKGQVRMKGNAPRDRYVEDWELDECLALDAKRKKGSVKMIQAYLRIKLLTGLRRSDMLRLTMTDLQDDGIHVKPHKTQNSTGKRIIITWSDELRQAVAQAKELRPSISPFLFCTRDGQSYINEKDGKASGFDSVWQRFMARVLAETKVMERFTEHDIRAKTGSDSENLESASERLAHADKKVTKRHYRRKAERIKPLR